MKGHKVNNLSFGKVAITEKNPKILGQINQYVNEYKNFNEKKRFTVANTIVVTGKTLNDERAMMKYVHFRLREASGKPSKVQVKLDYTIRHPDKEVPASEDITLAKLDKRMAKMALHHRILGQTIVPEK